MKAMLSQKRELSINSGAYLFNHCVKTFHKVVILIVILGHTLGRSYTNAAFVTRILKKVGVFTVIFGHCLGRNHTNAVFVKRLFQILVLLTYI